MENCHVLNLTLDNPTSEKITANILDGLGANSQVVITEAYSEGKVFNASGGAGSGVQLPTNTVLHSGYNTTTNIFYAVTQSGLWVYNVNTDTGSLITTATVVSGDSLPTNNLLFIAIDESNNILYIGHSLGMWVYTVGTNTGKSYTTVSGVSAGDNIPSSAQRIAIDFDNNILYAAGLSFLWKLELDTNTGDNISVATIGDNYPALSPNSIVYDSVNGIIYVGFNTPVNGIYQRIISTDTGDTIDTSYPVTGDNLPDNVVNFQIAIINNEIYFPTRLGIWIYNYLTNTGTVINSSSSVNGTPLPYNYIYTCVYDSDLNKLIVDANATLWMLDLSTNTGEVISTVDVGDNRPYPYDSYQMQVVNSVLWDTLIFAGIWRYEYHQEVTQDIISSNDPDGTDYDFMLNSLKFEPIRVNKIVFYSANALQKANNLKKVINTIYGDSVERQIQIVDYEDPNQVDHRIHIVFDEPITIGLEEFFQMDLEAVTSANMIFYYCEEIKEVQGGFIEHFGGYSVPEILPAAGGDIKEVKKSIVLCAFKPFLILLLGYIIYELFKRKK